MYFSTNYLSGIVRNCNRMMRGSDSLETTQHQRLTHTREVCFQAMRLLKAGLRTDAIRLCWEHGIITERTGNSRVADILNAIGDYVTRFGVAYTKRKEYRNFPHLESTGSLKRSAGNGSMSRKYTDDVEYNTVTNVDGTMRDVRKVVIPHPMPANLTWKSDSLVTLNVQSDLLALAAKQAKTKKTAVKRLKKALALKQFIRTATPMQERAQDAAKYQHQAEVRPMRSL